MPWELNGRAAGLAKLPCNQVLSVPTTALLELAEDRARKLAEAIAVANEANRQGDTDRFVRAIHTARGFQAQVLHLLS